MSAERLKRLLAFDRQIGEQARGFVAGIDEAGRGPLAGPVVAAAVVLLRSGNLERLNDSKKVSPKNRQRLFWEICRHGLVGIGVVDEPTIDKINIYQATRQAMKRAVLALPQTPDCLLVDGNMKLDLPLVQRALVGGDGKSANIAAASIIAKVYRDAWMNDLDRRFPSYDFKQHKGYPTPKHLQNLRTAGPSPVHRRSFAPVKDLIVNEAESL